MNPTRRQLLLASGALLALPQALHAQSKPVIRLLLGLPPGGATDAIARVIADKLPNYLGQPVIIENKPGVGGRLAADALLAAPANGLTYMVAPNAVPTFQMAVSRAQLKWDSLRDFVPVASFVSFPLGMAVTSELGVSNAKEFIEWVKKNPGKASYGAPGIDGQNAFLGVQLANTAGIDLPITPYKGTPPMVTDLVGGHLPAAISLLDTMMPHHQSGKIRIIGIFTRERSPLVPDIPTFAEQGIDVTSGQGWTGVWARKGTPDEEITRMENAIRDIMQQPDVQEIFLKRLYVQPDFWDRKAMDKRQRDELAHWQPIIDAAPAFKAQ